MYMYYSLKLHVLFCMMMFVSAERVLSSWADFRLALSISRTQWEPMHIPTLHDILKPTIYIILFFHSIPNPNCCKSVVCSGDFLFSGFPSPLTLISDVDVTDADIDKWRTALHLPYTTLHMLARAYEKSCSALTFLLNESHILYIILSTRSSDFWFYDKCRMGWTFLLPCCPFLKF
jgi:hypothetical protein